jgi:hypothetical protein
MYMRTMRTFSIPISMVDPMEAVRAAHYGEYSYNDDYVRFDGYGNLESLTEYDVERELKDNVDEIMDLIEENRSHLYLDPDLEELLDETRRKRRKRGRRRRRRIYLKNIFRILV